LSTWQLGTKSFVKNPFLLANSLLKKSEMNRSYNESIELLEEIANSVSCRKFSDGKAFIITSFTADQELINRGVLDSNS
jgi:hypothetical protein